MVIVLNKSDCSDTKRILSWIEDYDNFLEDL